MARLSPYSHPQLQVEDGYLIALAKQGHASAYDCIVRRYYGFVRLKASSYFLAGIAVATAATSERRAELPRVQAPSVRPQAAWLRLARCWPTLRLTRWRALSTVLQSQPIRRATSS